LLADDSVGERRLHNSSVLSDRPAMPANVRDFARTVPGFMPEEEGELLFRHALEGLLWGPVLEVGSYCGKSAVYLGAAAREAGGVVFTVDHHRGSEENQPGWEHHDSRLVDPAVGKIDTLPYLRRTIASADLESQVIAVVGESSAVARWWRTPLSMLFIDGGHGSEPAHNDLTRWAPWVAERGLLAIHDVFPDPRDGGRPPYEIYLRALAAGFEEIDVVGSLRMLRRTRGHIGDPIG
jgi:MMP 1-O-methyltransferase